MYVNLVDEQPIYNSSGMLHKYIWNETNNKEFKWNQ